MQYRSSLKSLFIVSKHWPAVRWMKPRGCSNAAKTSVASRNGRTNVDELKTRLSSGPSFQDFIKAIPAKTSDGDSDSHSYLSEELEMGNSRKGSCTCPQTIGEVDFCC